MMTDDSELLRRYARERSESAFAELVQRKAGLVYSAALRQVGGNAALAHDVSQSVFIDLARKAEHLAGRPVLASWLYTSTRFAALKALRSNQRRQIREQEALTMQDIERESMNEANWEQLRPLLDAEICDLPEQDRSAVLMRYFEGQPFAAMGARLGIGESSARMRAERALDKLRAGLARKGITSTAAALGLVLSTKAIAAPPVGLAATLAGGAFAHSASVGSGAGLLVKLYKFCSMNKIQSGAVAAIAVTTTGFASLGADEAARNTIFFTYSVCFGVGLLFTLLSAIGAHAFGGHGDVSHDFHQGHGSHAQGHAEGGGGANDMPGFAPVSPTTIATFITAFGGFGMIFGQFEPTRSPWISAPLAALSGLGIAATVFWLFRMIFQKTQASSEGHVAELVGCSATVITPIAAAGVGEIAYVQSGTRYSAPARSEDGVTFANGATVKITRVVGTQFYVSAF
jgi:RNA polymerase sigma factor (sigma-70 family)